MPAVNKEYIEADILIYALDKRDEDAKTMIAYLSKDESAALQEACANISYWISEINNRKSGSVWLDCDLTK